VCESTAADAVNDNRVCRRELERKADHKGRTKRPTQRAAGPTQETHRQIDR